MTYSSQPCADRMTTGKKAPSGSSLRSGLTEYEDKGWDLAIMYLGVVKVRPKTLSKEGVRQALDGLPGSASLQTTVADFWLSLPKLEARLRRANSPPANPFKRKGTDFLAPKVKIEEWELAWRLIEASRPLALSRLPKAREIADHMRFRHTWIFEGRQILGFANQPPNGGFEEALKHPELLSIQELTLADALQKPWKDPAEQRYWVERLKQGHHELERKLEDLALSASTPDRPHREGKGPIIL